MCFRACIDRCTSPAASPISRPATITSSSAVIAPVRAIVASHMSTFSSRMARTYVVASVSIRFDARVSMS